MRKLNLRILRADISRDPNFILKMDPYCVVRTSNAETRTSVVPSGGKHPVWNEAFSLDVTYDRFIDVLIYDQETVGKDNAIAQTVIDLTQLQSQSGTLANAYPLSYRGKACGQLFVEFNFGGQNRNLNGLNVGYAQAPVTTAAYSQTQTASYPAQGYGYSESNVDTADQIRLGASNLGAKVQNAYEQTKAKIADKLDSNPGVNANTAIAYPDRLPPARDDVAYQRNIGNGASVLQASQVAFHEPTVGEKLKQSLSDIGDAVQQKYQEVKERLSRGRGTSPAPAPRVDFNVNPAVDFGNRHAHPANSGIATNPLPITHPDFIRTFDNVGNYNSSRQPVLPPSNVHQSNLQYRSVDQLQFQRSLSGNYTNYPPNLAPATLIDNRMDPRTQPVGNQVRIFEQGVGGQRAQSRDRLAQNVSQQPTSNSWQRESNYDANEYSKNRGFESQVIGNNVAYGARNVAADAGYEANRLGGNASYAANNIAADARYGVNKAGNALSYAASTAATEVKHGAQHLKNAITGQSNIPADMEYGAEKLKNEVNYQGGKASAEVNLAADKFKNEVNYQGKKVADGSDWAADRLRNEISYQNAPMTSNLSNTVQQQTNDLGNSARQFPSNVANRVEQTAVDVKNSVNDFVNKGAPVSGSPYVSNGYQQYQTAPATSQSAVKQAVYVDQSSADFRASPAYRELRGKLIVKVLRAELNRDSNFIATMDPYCMLRTKGVELRTQVAEKGGKKPVWNAMFDVELFNDTSVYFGIWDRQTFSVDDIVADVTVDLRGNMKDLNRFVGWQPLYYHGDTAGRLFIELEYFPQGSGSNLPVQQVGGSYVNVNRDEFSRTGQAANYRA